MPPPAPVYIVFASTPLPAGVPYDAAGVDPHAQRFFRTRLRTAAGSVLVTPDGEAPGERAVTVRARSAEDLELAEEAERRAGGGGLVTVARRCRSVLVVTRESAADRLALRLAAILASAHLGPIVDPSTGQMFGVKTARAKLEALATGGDPPS
ncbi:MAG: hypothetical protein ACRELB_27400 [Polyangiaceae bacterium]